MTNAKPHYRTLDPFFSRLLRDGKAGWLVLVEVETGAIVARRRVGPKRAA